MLKRTNSNFTSNSIFDWSDIFEPIPRSLSIFIRFHLFSDAALDADGGGLGGWAHGEYWHFELSSADALIMHISAWEYIALALNIIIFGPR